MLNEGSQEPQLASFELQRLTHTKKREVQQLSEQTEVGIDQCLSNKRHNDESSSAHKT